MQEVLHAGDTFDQATTRLITKAQEDESFNRFQTMLRRDDNAKYPPKGYGKAKVFQAEYADDRTFPVSKFFKGNCSYPPCGKYGHKVADCRMKIADEKKLQKKEPRAVQKEKQAHLTVKKAPIGNKRVHETARSKANTRIDSDGEVIPVNDAPFDYDSSDEEEEYVNSRQRALDAHAKAYKRNKQTKQAHLSVAVDHTGGDDESIAESVHSPDSAVEEVTHFLLDQQLAKWFASSRSSASSSSSSNQCGLNQEENVKIGGSIMMLRSTLLQSIGQVVGNAGVEFRNQKLQRLTGAELVWQRIVDEYEGVQNMPPLVDLSHNMVGGANSHIVVPNIGRLLEDLQFPGAKQGPAVGAAKCPYCHVEAGKISRHGFEIDSGADVNVVKNSNSLKEVWAIPTLWTQADGCVIAAQHSGDLGNLGRAVVLPGIVKEIISVKAITKLGYEVTFHDSEVNVTKDGETLTLGEYVLTYDGERKFIFTIASFEGLTFFG